MLAPDILAGDVVDQEDPLGLERDVVAELGGRQRSSQVDRGAQPMHRDAGD